MDPHNMVHTANQIALNFALIRMKKPSPTSPLIWKCSGSHGWKSSCMNMSPKGAGGCTRWC